MPKVKKSSLPLVNKRIAGGSWKKVGTCFIGQFKKELREIAQQISVETKKKVFAVYNSHLFRAQLVTETGKALLELSAHGEAATPNKVVVYIPKPFKIKEEILEGLRQRVSILELKEA
jgi:hypothetical protein